MAIPVLDVTENYQALKILKKSQLSAAIGDPVPGSIEYYINTYVRNNFIQLAIDVLGPTYDFTNDGIPALLTPLIDEAGFLSEDEVVTGNWTFNGTVGYTQPATSTSTFTSSGQHRTKAYRSTSNQSIANNTPTLINFQNEIYDVGSLHDTAVNNTRITIPVGGAGLYLIHCMVDFDNNNTGRREVAIYKNGSAMAVSKEFAPDATQDTVLSLSLHDQANQNDYYEVQVFQSSGGALDVVLGQNVTNFSAMKVW